MSRRMAHYAKDDDIYKCDSELPYMVREALYASAQLVRQLGMNQASVDSPPELAGLYDRATASLVVAEQRRAAMAALAKRLTDLIGATLGVIVLFPLLLVVSLLIKASSRGPVLFKQTRIGLGGRPFTIYKFRSMVINAPELQKKMEELNEAAGPVFKIKNDPRITGIGRFIRAYSIDELPQLLNVIKGDMSLVGPRPPILKEVLQYEPWQRRRLSVIPGLTCIWQTSGRCNIGFDEWMKMDLQYIDQWSYWLDIKLILKTIWVVLKSDGAY